MRTPATEQVILNRMYKKDLDGWSELRQIPATDPYEFVLMARSQIPNGRVLDVGCGIGVYSNLFAVNGYEVVGIDLSSSALKLAADNVIPTVHLMQGDLRALPFQEGAFDIFFSRGVLDIVPRIYHEVCAQNLSRVVRPGGLAYLSVLSNKFRDPVVLAERYPDDSVSVLRLDIYFHGFSERRIRELFERQFNIEKLEERSSLEGAFYVAWMRRL